MIFKGPFMLIGLMVVDIYYFIKSLYIKNLVTSVTSATKKCSQHTENEGAIQGIRKKVCSCMNDLSHIDPRYFDIVKSILFKSRHKLVDMKKVIRELGDELDIHTHCRNIIYSPYKEMTCLKNNNGAQDLASSFYTAKVSVKPEDRDPRKDCSMYIIKQYNLCKRFLVANSIPLEISNNQQLSPVKVVVTSVKSTESERKMSKSNESNVYSDEETDAEEMKPTQFLFPINAHSLVKRIKVKKKRVIDASKILRICEEVEEQQHFKYIITWNKVTLDSECSYFKELLSKKIDKKRKIKCNRVCNGFIKEDFEF